MATIKRGTTVRQIVKPIEGVVVKTSYNEDTEQLSHLVAYMDDEGNPAQRWFDGSQIEVIEQPEQPAEEQPAAPAEGGGQ